MAKISIQTTRTAMPRCYCYSTPTISEHDGWVKIGYTEQDDVEDRIRQQLQTAHIPHTTEWSDIAVFADGRTYFRDSDFHAYLKKQGVERMKPMPCDKKQPEWFRINGNDSFTLYSKFRCTKGVMDTVGTIAYELRAEQEQAVSQTFDYFMSHEKSEFLWNAKPRFGKTLATYDLCKRLQATKGDYACNILIVTNRPAIANSWYEDFVKFIGTESGFRFVSEVSALKGKPFVMSRDEYTDSLLQEIADCIEFVSLPEDKPIFVNGKVYNSTVNDILSRHCKKLNLPEISIHGLRHTHASLLLFAGVSIASVARRLGHASMTTTQKTYLHIIQELENQDVDLVMRSLSGLS